MGFANPVNNLTVPTGATTGPRIVFGPDLPAPLASGTPVWRAAQVMYLDDTQFEFEAVGMLGVVPIWAKGTYDTVNGILFERSIRLTAIPVYTIGSNTLRLDEQFDNVSVFFGRQLNSRIMVGDTAANAVPLVPEYGAGNWNLAANVGNTASTVYADVPGSPTVFLTKTYLETGLRFDVHATCFNLTAFSQVRFGVRVQGQAGYDQTFDVCHFPFGNTGIQFQASGTRMAGTGLIPAGAVSCTMRWRNVAGVGTINQNANDWNSFSVRETSG